MSDVLRFLVRNQIIRNFDGEVTYNSDLKRPEKDENITFLAEVDQHRKARFWRALSVQVLPDNRYKIHVTGMNEAEKKLIGDYLKQWLQSALKKEIERIQLESPDQAADKEKPSSAPENEIFDEETPVGVIQKNGVSVSFAASSVTGRKTTEKNTGLFSGLFQNSGKNAVVRKIFYYGSESEIQKARARLDEVVRSLSASSSGSHLEAEEFVTFRALHERINSLSGIPLLIVISSDKLREQPAIRTVLDTWRNAQISFVMTDDLLAAGEKDIIRLLQTMNVPLSLHKIFGSSQRHVMFISNTGGVGKTTLATSLALWAVNNNINTIYVEMVGGGGIQYLMEAPPIMLEDAFQKDMFKIQPVSSPKIGDARGKLALVAVNDVTSSVLFVPQKWESFYHSISFDAFESSDVLWNLVIYDSLSQSFFPSVFSKITHFFYVTDRRDTTRGIAMDTKWNLLLQKIKEEKKGETYTFTHVANRVSSSGNSLNWSSFETSLEETVKRELGVPVQTIRIPAIPNFGDSILIKDPNQIKTVLTPIIQTIYEVDA